MSGNFGYTPSRLRNKNRGDFFVPAAVVPISDFRGFKARAQLGGFGSRYFGSRYFGDDIGDSLTAALQNVGQNALQEGQNDLTAIVLNDPNVQAQAAAAANKSAFQAFYDQWNSPTGRNTILMYGALAVGAVFLGSVILGRASVVRR